MSNKAEALAALERLYTYSEVDAYSTVRLSLERHATDIDRMRGLIQSCADLVPYLEPLNASLVKQKALLLTCLKEVLRDTDNLYATCCDTPSYCSSVRRCTAKDGDITGVAGPLPETGWDDFGRCQFSGCNVPEGECSGECMTKEKK